MIMMTVISMTMMMMMIIDNDNDEKNDDDDKDINKSHLMFFYSGAVSCLKLLRSGKHLTN